MVMARRDGGGAAREGERRREGAGESDSQVGFYQTLPSSKHRGATCKQGSGSWTSKP